MMSTASCRIICSSILSAMICRDFLLLIGWRMMRMGSDCMPMTPLMRKRRLLPARCWAPLSKMPSARLINHRQLRINSEAVMEVAPAQQAPGTIRLLLITAIPIVVWPQIQAMIRRPQLIPHLHRIALRAQTIDRIIYPLPAGQYFVPGFWRQRYNHDNSITSARYCRTKQTRSGN